MDTKNWAKTGSVWLYLSDNGNHGKKRGGHHYYVIPCRPRPPVAWDGRLATSELAAQSRECSECWRDRHHSQLRSWRMCTVGVEESFPPPQCCAENRQLQIPMLLDSLAVNTGHCRSVFLCFSCWLYKRVLLSASRAHIKIYCISFLFSEAQHEIHWLKVQYSRQGCTSEVLKL